MGRVFTVSLNPAIDRTFWLDRLERGAVHIARGSHTEAGGKGVNVSSGLASLGVPVTVCGWLGGDNAGRFEEAFAQRGIDDALVRVPGSSRVNVKITDASRVETTSIDLPGIALAPDALARAEAALHDSLDTRVAPGDWCILNGSLPPGVDAGLWERLARRMSARGAKLVFDMGGDVLRQLLQRLGPDSGVFPEFIKPNRPELEALAQRPLPTLPDVLGAARSCMAQGVPRVLVSLGAQGAVGVSAEGAWHADAPTVVSLVTTVGAGDAMVAGTVAAMLGTVGPVGSFAEAAAFGMACSAHRVQQTAPDLPAHDLLRCVAASIRRQPLDGVR